MLPSHVRDDGKVAMVDIGSKPVTDRLARARATLRMSAATEAALRSATVAKGDAFAVAQLAGIMAAKDTARLIPLAHPLPLSSVDVSFAWLDPGLLSIEAIARTSAKTGVEMEAMTAASVAALAMYDMLKSLEKGIAIESIRLLEKTRRQERHVARAGARPVVTYGTAVLVLSDRVSAGVRADGCIPAVRESLDERFEVVRERILADDPAALQAELIDLADRLRVPLVLTSGGTGLAPRDRTPQATAGVLDYEVPGIAEAMRAASAAFVPTAMLSRAVAGVRGSTLIVNLPGSPKAVRETLAAIRGALPHALDLLSGTISDG